MRATLVAASRLARRGAPVLLAAALAACTSWRVQGEPASTVVSTRHPASIRVTRSDLTGVVLHAPRLAGDTVVGFADGARTSGDGARRIAIPAAQVRAVSIRERDVVKTAALVLAIGLTAAAALFLGAFGQALALWYDD
ncbi:MAG TPA: hypothetical protein VFS44_03275 [Gemmatimonadaceae bacterium]|nr:hypothetical protein [Gemmatimonadaceae bacterium]